MNEQGPRFEDLVGDDLPAAERERLRRVHDLLVAAGPPPELPPHLAEPPQQPGARVIPIRRERWRTAAVAAAAALVVAFAAGWLVGGSVGGDDVAFAVAMNGSNGAHATLDVLSRDGAGNWPMKMTVTGLHPLAGGHTYALWLTRHGHLESQCGTFTVGEGATTVRLNAPFQLREYSGWVVVVTGTTTPMLRTATV
jgi:hypothetical protein